MPALFLVILRSVCILPNSVPFTRFVTIFRLYSSHRFPSDHSCKETEAHITPRNETAKALRVKYFPLQNAAKPKEPQPSSSSLSPNKAKKSQGAKLIQLMKMRQSASVGDPSTGPNHDLSDRLHIQVKLDSSDAYRTFWFPKVSFIQLLLLFIKK